MAVTFDPFSLLDPARARRQMEADKDTALFDNFSALDPARELRQIESAYGIEVSPLAALDPARVQYDVENSDTTPPDSPIVLTPSPGTARGSPIRFSGTTEANAIINIYLGDAPISEPIQADESGNWDAGYLDMDEGTGVNVSVTATDQAGNTSEPTDLTFNVLPLLLSRWTFDTAHMSGATVQDSAGSADGTLVGSPSLVTGIVGDQAVQLANNQSFLGAATQYMKILNAVMPQPTSMSFSWRGKNIVLPGSNNQEAFVATNEPGNIASGGFSVTYSRANSVLGGKGWICRSSTDAFPATNDGPVARFDNNAPNGSGTHFYVATYDEAASQNWRFFIDGVESGLTASDHAGIGKPLLSSIYDMFFGCAQTTALGPPNDTIRGVQGILDDARHYSRPLTPTEIQDRNADPTIP